MDLMLADTGGSFDQWLALHFTALNGGSIDHSELVASIADALKADDKAAQATLAGMEDERLLQTAPGSVVALSDAGRDRYERIRAALDQITAALYGDLPPHDLAATRRVLTTISDRADILLDRA
jgi:DNA-binding MarR family transcriptional regulator